jgi:NAD(P)-dependent dehydrogenase (short-subunit alcohol dehydrogenase family)
MRFKKKSILVTGGDKGIGRAIVIGFAEEGANIVLGYHSDREAAEYTAKKIGEIGAKYELVKADVRIKKDCENLVDVAVKSFGHLDIAVNNAAVSTMKRQGAVCCLHYPSQVDKSDYCSGHE